MAKPTTPRTKRVHSNSNRKNAFSDYEFSIFTPVLNFFHAHRVSAKELRSKSLNLFAIRHECRTEIRSARLAEESQAKFVRDISLSLKMTEILVFPYFDTESVNAGYFIIGVYATPTPTPNIFSLMDYIVIARNDVKSQLLYRFHYC